MTKRLLQVLWAQATARQHNAVRDTQMLTASIPIAKFPTAELFPWFTEK
jgi:hypothetical protein